MKYIKQEYFEKRYPLEVKLVTEEKCLYLKK